MVVRHLVNGSLDSQNERIHVFFWSIRPAQVIHCFLPGRIEEAETDAVSTKQIEVAIGTFNWERVRLGGVFWGGEGADIIINSFNIQTTELIHVLV